MIVVGEMRERSTVDIALKAAETWVAKPTDENRRAAYAAAEMAGFGTPDDMPKGITGKKRGIVVYSASQTAAWTIHMIATTLWHPARGSVCPHAPFRRAHRRAGVDAGHAQPSP